jgi:putative glutamine amidotransferase
VGKIAKFRDVFELALIEIALEKDIPILGICRGMQIINIFFGGTLYQHLDSSWLSHIQFEDNQTSPKRGKSHSVTIKDEGLLSRCLDKKQIPVNSEHHQGIAKLGRDLTIEATSEDDLVEALSVRDGKVLGVQWHPELDLQDVDQLKILNGWLETV